MICPKTNLYCANTGCGVEGEVCLIALTRPYGRYAAAPPPTGWICPRCNAANAPHIDRCSCSAIAVRLTNSFEEQE